MSASSPRTIRLSSWAGFGVALLLGCSSASTNSKVRAVQADPGSSAEASKPTAARAVRIAPGPVVGTACVPVGPEHCFNARDDNCNGALDEGCGVPGGLLQFSIAWREPGADVDLDVIDPKGELAEVGRVTATGLIKERDCPGRDNECKGLNIENVLLETEDELTRGVYTVKIRLERVDEIEEPVTVNFAARLGPKVYAAELELEKVQDQRQLALEL